MAKEGKRKFTHNEQQAVLFSSDLKEEPARGSKYCPNKRYQNFLVNFGQPVYKETKTSKLLMEVWWIFLSSQDSHVTSFGVLCNIVSTRGLQCLSYIHAWNL